MTNPDGLSKDWLYSPPINLQADDVVVLGVITDTPTLGKQAMTINTVGEIRMSPQLVFVLAGQLKLYEELYGIIPLHGK